MRSDPDYVKLSISDNGRGFDLNDVPEDKLGLSIMSERAEEVGADLEVISSPGQGTQVTLTWHVSDSSLRSE
jgi:signal transduction histidine kinase